MVTPIGAFGEEQVTCLRAFQGHSSNKVDAKKFLHKLVGKGFAPFSVSSWNVEE